MRHKTFLAVAFVLAVAVSVMGCGVPKTEHDKVVKALEQANQEKADLTGQIDKLTKEKDSLSQQVAQLQKENEELKTKAKPAAKKAPAKKK
jgi:peptidoglycan hydrolase CwlO-like protein